MVKPSTHPESCLYLSWRNQEATEIHTHTMGLSNFPLVAEGVLPIIVMNTVISVAILKKLLKSVLEIMGTSISSNMEEDPSEGCESRRRRRRVSITQFKSLCESQASEIDTGIDNCSVCLNRFEEDEEVSELSCKHFFHRSCLEKWFDNHHSTCPLCRSIN